MIQTAQAVIYQALRKLGQLRPGWTPSPELMNDALTEWGALFDEMAAEQNTQYSNPVFQYAVTGPGSATGGNGYIIGPPFNFTGTLVIGSAIVSALSSLQGIIVGALVTGTGIPANTRVTAMGAASITLSQNATVAGAQTITQLPDFNGPRPESIIQANMVLTNVGTQPVYIPLVALTQIEWANLAIQQIPGVNITNVFWYDPQFPQGVFNVFPPLTGNSLQFYTWGVLAPPASLSSTWNAPPGYWDLVVFALAQRLYYMVTKEILVGGKVPYATIAGQALRARNKVKSVNRPIPLLGNGFAKGPGRGGFFDRNVTYTGNP